MERNPPSCKETDDEAVGRTMTVADGANCRFFNVLLISRVSRFRLGKVVDREKDEYLVVKPVLTKL